MSAAPRSNPSRRRTYRDPSEHVPFLALIGAEFHRTRQTRSTVILITVFVGIALVWLIVRAVLSGENNPIGAETVTLSADVVGFAVLLATAISVARDHQNGTIDLLRVLTPFRPRHFAARATGFGLLALAAISIVMLAGAITVFVLNPAALSLILVDTIARTTVTTFLLAWAGVGIGALTRSTAAATFIVITLYLLIPIALLIAGFTGASWATPLSEASLGILAASAIAPGPGYWAAATGIAVWATALTALGILRETKGN